MENQTHAQNQRVPVIQVSGLKKQYKLGQIGGGTLTPVSYTHLTLPTICSV